MPTEPPSTDAAVEAQVFWIKLHKEITAFLIILILAIVGFAGYRFYAHRTNSTAASCSERKEPAGLSGSDPRDIPNARRGDGLLLMAQAQRAEKNFAASNTTVAGIHRQASDA